jgi:hypothetical protein
MTAITELDDALSAAINSLSAAAKAFRAAASTCCKRSLNQRPTPINARSTLSPTPKGDSLALRNGASVKRKRSASEWRKGSADDRPRSHDLASRLR